MHITLLSQYYPPEVGAPQARLSELAAHFVQRGHSVTVLTAMPNYPIGRIHAGYAGILRREQVDGVKLIRTFIFATQKPGLAHRMTNYLSFVISSATIGSLFLTRTDYLLVESPPLFLGLSAVWLSRLKRARMIFNVSDLWPESAVQLGLLSRESKSFKASLLLEKLCYNHAWLITGQSHSILDDIHKRFPDRATFHLSNGVDTRRFSPNQCTGDARATLCGNADCVVLYAGLHGLAQGLEQVMEAAEGLRSETGLVFVLIGDGPEKNELRNSAKRRNLTNVHFLDSRPAAEIPALIAAADIVLVPLKKYIPGAVPSKLYEAMASARPVILIAEGEAAEIVERHKAGIVVQPGYIDRLVKAIQSLRSDFHLRRELGENGRRGAEQNFDRAKIASRFIDYLEANL
jgi:glycosyltransferase involved in cell wall biosynthesis